MHRLNKINNGTPSGRQRSGVEDVGMEYQYNVITYMAAALSENPTVENFTIFSNLPDIPGFDDLILKVWYQGERHPYVYLGQIKHRSSKINFETEKHKLADYKRDFAKIIYSKDKIGFLNDVPIDNVEFIFYSNNILAKSKSIIIDKQVPYAPLKCSVQQDESYRSTFPVKVSRNFYKFIAHSHVDDDDLLFLNKTHLILNQSCNRKVIYDIVDIYKKEFSKEMAFATARYVREYFRIPTVANITKEIFETELLRIRLSKYIVSPMKAVEIGIEQARIWNDITLNHDVTVVDEGNNVQALLSGCLSQRINDLHGCDFKWNDCIDNCRMLSSDFNIQSFVDRSKLKGVRYWLTMPDTIDLLLQEMWKYNDLPLVLKTEDAASLLQRYKHLGKKFIVICDVGKKYIEMNTMGLKTFASFADITDSKKRRYFLASIRVSLQGRQPTSLIKIVDFDGLCMKELNCAEILHLIRKRTVYLEERSFKKVELLVIIKTVPNETVEESETFTVNDSTHKNILINCHKVNVEAYINLIKEHAMFQNYSIYSLQKTRHGLKFISGDKERVKQFLVDEDGNHVVYTLSGECSPVIGNILGRHEEAYISRRLRKPIINQSIFNAKPRIYFFHGNLGTLDNAIRMKITTKYISIENMSVNENTFLYIAYGECNLKQYKLKTASPLVSLNVVDGQLLLLDYENCNDLSSYVSYGDHIVLEDLFFEGNHHSHGITAISGEAGMGKTSLLHSLSQACDGKYYVLFCDLVDYAQEVKQSKNVKLGLDHIFNKSTGAESRHVELLRAIYTYHRNMSRIILFIDSFDEVLPVCEEEALNFIKDISKANTRIIIASRTIAKKLLLNNMVIYPLRIADLTVDKLNVYMKARNLTNTELRKIPKQFLANPLLLKFLIFLCERRKLDFQNMDIAHLYKLVILEKIERYHDKLGLLYDPKMDYLNEEVLEVHRLMALVAIFGEKWLTSKKIIRNYQKLVNQLNSQKIKLGMVKDFRNGRPVFIHHTIAEFLFAEWLNENIEEDSAVHIYKKMVYDCDDNIQYLFDIMACKDLELHMAVINGDLNLVQDLCRKSNISIGVVDKCQRNCLHLASSYCFNEQRYKIVDILLNRMLREEYDFNAPDRCMGWRWLDCLKYKNPTFFETACSFGSTTALKAYLKFENKSITDNDISNALLNGHFHTLLFLFKINKSLVTKHFDRALNIAVDRGCSTTACKLIQMRCGDNARLKMFLKLCQNLRAVDEMPDVEYIAEMKANRFTALHIACMFGHAQMARKLLQSGSDVAAVDAYGRTPLHYAVLQGSNGIVCLLLESVRTNVNAKDESGRTALHWAVKWSNWKTAWLLLENGASVNDKTYSGETNLETAIVNGLPQMCRMLLEYGSNIEEENANGLTAFLVAAERGHLEILRILLDHGADITKRDYWGNSALHLACFQGHGNIIEYLVRKSRDLVPLRNHSDLTPLEIVVMYQYFDIVDIFRKNEEFAMGEENLLLDSRETFESDEGYTPLHFVKSIDEAQLELCDAEKVIDVNARARNGETPLHVACRNGYIDVVEALLSAKADISIQNDLGQTVLHIATQNNNLDLVKVLLKHGANINYVDNNMETSLHVAAKNQSSVVMEFLLAEGANVDQQNYDGRCVLHIAAKMENPDITEMLLRYGVNVNQVDFCEITPLHVAVEYQNEATVKVLLEHGANNDLVDICENTALHVAVECQNVNIVEQLIKHGANASHLNREGKTALHIAAIKDNSLIQKVLFQHVIDGNNVDFCKDVCLRITVLHTDVKMAQAMIERGADVNHITDFNESVLHIATRQGNVEMVKMLLGKGAYINCVDHFNEIPLHISVRYRYLDVLQLLLENGCDVNSVNKSGDTALHLALDNQNEYITELLLRFNTNIRHDKKAILLAVKHQNVNILKKLIKHGLDIQNDQQSALHTAIECENLENARRLLEEGIDTSLVNMFEQSPLHVGVEKGNIESVKLLLQEGMDINFVDSSKQSSLHVAVEKQNLSMINILVDNGIDLNIVNYLKQSVLHLAVRLSNVEITRVLLKKGVDVNLVDNNGQSALHIAVERNNADIVDILLENDINVNIVNSFQQTALHCAVRMKIIDIVKTLLHKGADVNFVDCNKRSALHVAVRNKHLDMVNLLLTEGVDLNVVNSPDESILHSAVEVESLDILKDLLKSGMDINFINSFGRLVLDTAVQKKNLTILKYLVENDINLNWMLCVGESALHVAIKNESIDIVEYLLERGVNANHESCCNISALNEAIRIGNIDIVKLLLKYSVDVNLSNAYNKPALHTAVEKGNTEIVQCVFDAGADVNIIDAFKRSALHVAIAFSNADYRVVKRKRRRRVCVDIPELLANQQRTPKRSNITECVKLLLDNDININLVDARQRSALQMAIEQSEEEVAIMLLDNEADVNLVDNVGNNVLHIAAHYQNIIVAEIILKRIADVNKANFAGWTALHFAVTNRREDIVRLFLEKGAEVNKVDHFYRTPLSIAATNCDYKIVKMLLECGADVNFVDENRCSILRHAVQSRNADLVKLILESGADICHRDSKSRTPLDVAAELDDEDITKLLLLYRTENK